MTPEEVREIVREEIEAYAAKAFEVLAPGVADLMDVYGYGDMPIVGPVFNGLISVLRPGDGDSAAA